MSDRLILSLCAGLALIGMGFLFAIIAASQEHYSEQQAVCIKAGGSYVNGNCIAGCNK